MKLRTILIGSAVVIFLGLVITTNILWKKYQTEKADRIRLEDNVAQLLAENKQNVSLLLTKDEFISSISIKLKRALDSLKIAPKRVLKIEEKIVVIRDTVNKLIITNKLMDKSWQILDREKCWMWEGRARIENDSLVVRRVGFDYQNKTTDIFSKKLKFKFLFIKFYSRKEFVQNSISECGSSTSKVIQIK